MLKSKYRQGSKCPICGAGRLIMTKRDVILKHNRDCQKVQLIVYDCPVCGYGILDDEVKGYKSILEKARKISERLILKGKVWYRKNF